MVEWDLKPGSLVLGSVFLVYVTAVLAMELAAWTCSRVLAQIETPYDDGEVLFPLRFPQPISKLMVRLVEHKLCSVPFRDARSPGLAPPLADVSAL